MARTLRTRLALAREGGVLVGSSDHPRWCGPPNGHAHQLRAIKTAPAQTFAPLVAPKGRTAPARRAGPVRPVGCMRGLDAGDILPGELRRVTGAVEQHESPNPAGVRLDRARAMVVKRERGAKLGEDGVGVGGAGGPDTANTAAIGSTRG